MTTDGGVVTAHSGAARRQSMLLERFGKKLVSVRTINWNEVHAEAGSKEDIPELCLYVRDELKGKLATVICSDERRVGGGFLLRYAFGIPTPGRSRSTSTGLRTSSR